MKNNIICLDIAVCSNWGRRLPLHIFYTQYARKKGHRYCLNCGLTKGEVRKEEKFNQDNEIETRVIDFHSDLENPTYLSEEDLEKGNYRVFI